MKKVVFILFCMVVLIGYGASVNADHLGIKKASEYIVIPLIEPLDTAGVPLIPDSVHIITYADNASAASFLATNTSYPFAAVGIDTIKSYGDTAYFFVDQIQDIDGGGGNFELAVMVTFFCDGLPTTTNATVQVVTDSLENFLDASKDSSSSAAVLSKNNLDTLQAQDDWIAKEASVDALEDSLFAVIDSLQAWSANIALLVAMRDSINAALDTIQLWSNDIALLIAMRDSINAALDTLQNQDNWIATVASLTAAIDSINAILDSLQAGFGSRTAIVLSAAGVDALWDEDTTGHGTAKSFAVMLKDTSVYQGAAGALTAADVWNIAFATAFTAGSMGDSLNNSSYVQGSASGLSAAEVADTLANRGYYRGAGARTVIITLKNDADSVAISGYDVTARDSTSLELKARRGTNTAGLCTLSLDDGTYSFAFIKTPWTITSPVYPTISSDTTLTYYATAFDPGAPGAPTLCRIYAWESDFEGAIEGGWLLKVFISDKYAPVKNTSGNIVGRKGRNPAFYLSDADSGYMFLDVYRSDSLTAADTTKTVKYHFRLYNKDGDLEAYKNHYEVPESTSHKIIW